MTITAAKAEGKAKGEVREWTLKNIPIFKQDLSGGGNNAFRSQGQWKKITPEHVSQMSAQELGHYFIVIPSNSGQHKVYRPVVAARESHCPWLHGRKGELIPRGDNKRETKARQL